MPTILTEHVDLSEAIIDADARVLRNVKLIAAGTSLNRRHYSEDVLKQAAPLFEGVKAYDGHDSRNRKVAEITGYYANPRYENGAIRADRHFTNTQAGRDVWAIAEAIANGSAPKNLAGISISAVGTGKQQKLADGDAFVVESITKADSVDDVTNPAAGGSYKEAASGDALALALLEAMTFEEFYQARPDYVKRLQNEVKNARRDDELKALQNEADHKVKAAEDVAEQATAALVQAKGLIQEAQTTNERLTTERDAAAADLLTARRELAVEQALNDPKLKLPASWKKSLREQLNNAPAETWGGIIQNELDKVSAAERQRVPVTGAGQQVSPVTEAAATPANAVPNWTQILSSPEAFAAWQRSAR